MFFHCLASSLLLFQTFRVNGQVFSMGFLPVVPLPSNATVMSVIYDETNQCFYLGGTVATSLDGQPYGGNGDFFVSKHNMNGTRVWSRLTGGPGIETGNKLIRVPETGHLFLVGSSTSQTIDNRNATGQPDSVVIKYSQNGTKLFSRFFGRTGTSDSNDEFVDAQNQQLIVGGIYNGQIDFTVNDMNNGTLMRHNALTSAGRYYGLVPVSGSASDCFGTGYIAGGLDGQSNSGGYDVFLVKLNYLNGTRYWTLLWGDVLSEGGIDVQYDPVSRLVFVAGYTIGLAPLNGLPAYGDYDAIMLCTSDNGTYRWASRFGTAQTDVARTIGIHPSTGTLFVVGYYASYNGFVSTFAQNGTLVQFSISDGPASYKDIVFSSDATAAYVCDHIGGSAMLTLNIAVPLLLAVPRTTVSTLSSFASVMTTNRAPLATLSLPTSTIPVLSTILTKASLSTPELPGISQSTFYSGTESPGISQSTFRSGTATFTSTIFENVENVSVRPVSVGFTWLTSPVGIISIACALLVAVLVCACICFKMRTKISVREVPLSISDSSKTTSDFTQITSANTYQQTSSTTFLRSDFELSLPGYLMFEAKISFRIKKRLAKGGGGVVYIADVFTLGLSAYGPTIVVKTVGSDSDKPLPELSEQLQKSFKQEISIMHYFRAEKHIAKLLGWTDDPACILMKFYSRGSLESWIYGDSYKSRMFQLQYMNDISRGVLAMHKAGFVHSDLKPQNVLVDEDEQGQLFCCLTDFGITQVVDETSLLVKDFSISRIRGLSIQYAAPEALQRYRRKILSEGISAEIVTKIDLYSYAMIMNELLQLRLPWHN